MNRLKGIIIVVFLALASLMMPFNIYADTLPSSAIIGTNLELITVDTISSGNNNISYRYVYKVHVLLDDYYLGTSTGTYSFTYWDGNQYQNINVPNIKKYINGNEITYTYMYVTSTYWANGGGPLSSVSYLNTSSNVTKYSDIDSMQQIIDILQDVYSDTSNIGNIENDQLTELENILLELQNQGITLTDINDQLIDANNYLDKISKLRQYNFPIESLGAVSMMYYLNSTKVLDFFVNGYYNYPVFRLNNNDTLFQVSTYTSRDSYYIVFSQYININTVNNIISILNGTISNVQQISNLSYSGNGQTLQCYKITFRATGSSTVYFRSVGDHVFIPISFSVEGYSKYSTDFALLYGFSNPLLDDLHIIAQGTTQSNQANQQLDSNTSQFQTDSSDLIDIENTMSNNMDSAMQQITPSSNPGTSFGGNFLTSAVWVRTQFERLTNGNPFGSLIVYGLTLGLALLLLGKVFL